jgi:hypothetical protein
MPAAAPRANRFAAGLTCAAAMLLPGVRLLAQDSSGPAIEDNSFFIEEAYNQEDGVVQHINTFAVAGPSNRDLFYTFTQEWPFHGQTNQLSYTVPVTRLGGQSGGVGDVLLNYRYQLGGGKRRWAVAPRLSAVLPTGSVHRGLGDGSPGLQANIPLSYRLTRDVVTHWNIGGTLLPWARGPVLAGSRPKRTLTSGFVGASVIGPTRAPIQLMVENLISVDGTIARGGSVDHATTWVFSPGVRAAINLGTLQIVPGVALPFSRSGGLTDHQAYFYLSFEHPFSSAAATGGTAAGETAPAR